MEKMISDVTMVTTLMITVCVMLSSLAMSVPA